MVLVGVHNESKCFELCDAKELVTTVGGWKEFIAANAGIFKDQAAKVGMHVESVITDFPDF